MVCVRHILLCMCYPLDLHTHEGSYFVLCKQMMEQAQRLNSLPMVTNAINEREDFRTETLKHLHDVPYLNCDQPSCWALIICSAYGKGNMSVVGVKKLR